MQSSVSYPPKSSFEIFFKVGGAGVPVLLAFVAVVWLISEQALDRARQFSENGEAVNAIVMNKYSAIRDASEGHPDTNYFLDLKYETLNGEMISLDRRVRRTEYN